MYEYICQIWFHFCYSYVEYLLKFNVNIYFCIQFHFLSYVHMESHMENLIKVLKGIKIFKVYGAQNIQTEMF